MEPIAKFSFFLIASFVISSAAIAQTFFRTWFDAPETVIAGETFTVDVWAEVSGDWVGEGAFSSYLSSSLMSIEVTGDLNAFAGMSTATIHTNLPLDRGTVDGTMLRDVLAYNTTSLEGYTSENPLRFFSFDITTAVGETGELSLLHHPSSVSPDLLSWYVDPFVGDDWYLGSADDNSVLTTESFTVRVIPTPAAAALLAFAGLATLRRQR